MTFEQNNVKLTENASVESEEYLRKKEYVLNYIKKCVENNDFEELECFLYHNINFIKNDKEIALAATRMEGNNLQFFSDKIKDDKDIIFSLGDSQFYSAFRYASVRLRSDKKVAMEAISKDVDTFQYLSENLRDDEEIALAAIKSKPELFKSVSDRLKSNRNFVLKAVKLDPEYYVVEYMSDVLRNDEEIILEFIKNRQEYINVKKNFEYVGDNLKKNRSFILKVLKLESQSSSWIFEYISEELRNDKEIALAALQKESFLVQFLGEELCDDEEIMMIVIKDHYDNYIKFASDRLKKNKKFILNALKYNDNIFPYIAEELKDNEEIALTAIKSKPELFELVSNRLKNNRDFILKAIKYNSSIFEYVPDVLKNDPEILLSTISNGVKNDKMHQYINNYLEMTNVLDLISKFDKPNKNNLNFEEAFMQKINYIQVENNKEQEQCVEYIETLFKFISAVENNEEPYMYLYKIQGSKLYSYVYDNVSYQYVKTNMVSDECKNLLNAFEIIQRVIYNSKFKNVTEYYIKNGYKILKDFLNSFDALKDKISIYDSMLFELMAINVLEQIKKLQNNIYKISSDELEQGLEYLKSDFKSKLESMNSNKKSQEIEVEKDDLKL